MYPHSLHQPAVEVFEHQAERDGALGGTQAENKPTHLVGDRKFASDP